MEKRSWESNNTFHKIDSTFIPTNSSIVAVRLLIIITTEVVAYHRRSFDGHICTRTDCDADIRLRQCGRVVDAIADQSDLLALKCMKPK